MRCYLFLRWFLVTVLDNGDLQLNMLTLSGKDELEPITLDERCVFDLSGLDAAPPRACA